MDVPRHMLAGDTSTENKNGLTAESPAATVVALNGLNKVSEVESGRGQVPRLDFSAFQDSIASFNLGSSIQLADNPKIDGFDNSSVGSKCMESPVCSAFVCKRFRCVG